MNYEDYHVHTEFSDDSVYPMEQVVKDAVHLGITELCFTDHVDYGIKPDWDEVDEAFKEKARNWDKESDWQPGMERPVLNVDYDVYFPRIHKLQKQYQDQIALKTGMEFGIQSHTTDRYEKLYNRYKDQWDFILLSLHQVNDLEFWTQDFQKGKTQKEYNRAYYEELLKVVKNYKHYSVLAHMDLIIRYDKEGILPFEENLDLVTEILKTVIADGKGLEINTSGVRYGFEDLHPSRKLLQLYKELGGTILTFGSDSHKPEHLGKYIQQQKQQVKELGFTRYCTFEKMKPVFHDL